MKLGHSTILNASRVLPWRSHCGNSSRFGNPLIIIDRSWIRVLLRSWRLSSSSISILKLSFSQSPIIRVFKDVEYFISHGNESRLGQLKIPIVWRAFKLPISPHRYSKFSHPKISKTRREFKHPIIFSGRRFCLVVILSFLRLIRYRNSLGISSSSLHPSNIRVSNFCNLQMDFVSFFILRFPSRLRYLRCFKLPIFFWQNLNIWIT